MILKICKKNDLINKKYLIKFFPELKDELIVFLDENQQINCLSSVCPHLAGEICYDKKELFCKWHGLKFDFNGQVKNCRYNLKLKKYNAKIIEEYIYVEAE